VQDQDKIETTSEPLPGGFEIEFFDDYMKITKTWFNIFNFIGLLICTLLFNGLWMGSGFLELLTGDREWFLKLFALVFVFLGVGLAYFSIATFSNTTQILVSRDMIEIKHRPIPWFGNKRVDVNNLKQLLVKEKSWGSSNGSPRLTYNVHGLTKEDKLFKLVTGLETGNQALYIEQEIEKYLGIENVQVDGEFK